jgi:hypothetical protein
MKAQELKQLIREEVSKILTENDSFGDEVIKRIQAERLAQQRNFIKWAKKAAGNMSLNFNGDSLVTVSINKLFRKGILTPEVIQKWEQAPEGSEENELFQGLSALLTRYRLLRAF